MRRQFLPSLLLVSSYAHCTLGRSTAPILLSRAQNERAALSAVVVHARFVSRAPFQATFSAGFFSMIPHRSDLDEQNKPCKGDPGSLVCTGGTERDDQPCTTLSDCGNSKKGDAPDFGSGRSNARLSLSRLRQVFVLQNVRSGMTVLFRA